jgi:hypothetical protein
MDSGSDQTPLSPRYHEISFWAANERRLVFLLVLLIGLALFLIWLPVEARASLLSALVA